MALDIFEWENGTLVEPAKVEIGGVSYDVTDAQYEGSTPISASNMNQMQTILNNNITTSINEISTYSETEQRIGTWINNKPLYRKCFKKTGNVTSIQSGISNLDDVINLTVMVKGADTNGLWRTIPWCFNNSTYVPEYTGGAYVRASDGSIGFQAGSGLTTTDKYIVIIEYTKTTD